MAEPPIIDAIKLKEQGNEHFKSGQFEEALGKYEEALKQSMDESTNAIIEYNAGLCCHKLNNKDESKAHMEKAILKNPKYIKPYILSSKIHEEKEEYEKALENIKAALAIDNSLIELKNKEAELESKNKEKQEKMKNDALGALKDLGNKILGGFGMSLNNFNMNKNADGSFNIQYKN